MFSNDHHSGNNVCGCGSGDDRLRLLTITVKGIVKGIELHMDMLLILSFPTLLLFVRTQRHLLQLVNASFIRCS